MMIEYLGRIVISSVGMLQLVSCLFLALKPGLILLELSLSTTGDLAEGLT
jgi:hypothetical protein